MYLNMLKEDMYFNFSYLSIVSCLNYDFGRTTRGLDILPFTS